VPVPVQNEAANDHLDTLEGRYLLQLEWRALAAALRCKTQPACQQAVSDALVFRSARYQLFPSAAAQEKSLELNEGVAEYTGVSLGNKTHASQVQAALFDLSVHIGDQTFVRSFAYATGPAYGLLLDKYLPGWKQQLRNGQPLNDLLQRAAHISLPQKINDAAAERAPANSRPQSSEVRGWPRARDSPPPREHPVQSAKSSTIGEIRHGLPNHAHFG
jgi:hypothetical protein